MRKTVLLAALLCATNAFAQIPGITPRPIVVYDDDPQELREALQRSLPNPDVVFYEKPLKPQRNEQSARPQPGGQYERERSGRSEAEIFQRGHDQGRRDEARQQRSEQLRRRDRNDGHLGDINVR